MAKNKTAVPATARAIALTFDEECFARLRKNKLEIIDLPDGQGRIVVTYEPKLTTPIEQRQGDGAYLGNIK